MSRAMPEDAHPVPEFDCSECRRHIVVICGPLNEFNLCAACMTLPGWYEIPELRRLLHYEEAEYRENFR